MAGRHYTALGYCDETDIENFLLLDIDNSFSAQVEDWIAGAEKTVNDYLGYTTASGIFREQIVGEKNRAFVDSDSNLKIFPNKIPIVSVSKIEIVKGTSTVELSLADSNGTLKYDIPVGDNHISYPNYELSITGNSVIRSFNDLRPNSWYVKMDYIAGFEEVPADIRLATANLVADTIMRQANKEGLEQITQGRVTKRWKERRGGESDFYLDALNMLQSYRIASSWI